jgi:WD40 repeat protein
MKISLPFFCFSLIFLMISCDDDVVMVTVSATAVSHLPQATETAVSPTNTPLSPTPTATATNTKTPLPTLTLSPPFTQGRIVFLWDQRTEPGLDGPGGFQATMGLYQALPGTLPDEWTIEPLLTESVINQLYPSPDQTKLAVLLLEDMDGDELFTTWDDYKIHIYQFDDSGDYSVHKLDNQNSLAARSSLSWLPDNQAVYYPQSANIELARLDGSSPEMLTDNPLAPIEGEPYNYIYQLVGSPDGTLLALDMVSGIGLAERGLQPVSRDLTFFDTATKEFITIIEHFPIPNAGYFNMSWSPDSQWLAFANDGSFGLSVLNAQTHAIQQLVDPAISTLPSWSPDGQKLAFTNGSVLYLWDATTQTVVELTQKDMLSSEPAWSPDGSLLAAAYSLGSEGGILFIDPVTREERLLPLEISTRQVIWSPDGEWLTGIFGGVSEVGLFVVNKDSGESHFLLDTAGQNTPSTIMWLSK